MARKKKEVTDPIIIKAAELVILGVYGRGRELRRRLDLNYGYIGGATVILAEAYKMGYTENG